MNRRVWLAVTLVGLALMGVYSTALAFQGMTLYTGRTWIANVDSTGRERWRKEVGLPYSTRCSNIVRISHGNLVLFGWAEPDPDTVSSVSKKVWPYLIVADWQGNELWAQKYDFNEGRCVHGTGVSPLPEGGFLLTGMTIDGPRWVMRVAEDGSEVWRKLLGDSLGAELINVAPDRHFLIGECPVPGNRGFYRATFAELTADGTVSWRREYGTTKANHFSSVCTTKEDYVAVGYTEGSGEEGHPAWIVKLGPAGDVLWEKRWRGGKYSGFSEVRRESNGYAAYGGADSGNVIVHYDEDGNELNTEDLGSDQIKFITDADGKSQPARMTRTQVNDSVSVFRICVDSSLCIPFEITRSHYQRSLLGNVFVINRNEYVITGWTETFYAEPRDPTRLKPKQPGFDLR